jgi:integrase
MSQKAPKCIHAPVAGDFLRLHRESGQGYVLIPQAGGGRRRQCYVGPFYGPDGETSEESLQAARRLLREAKAGVLRPGKATGRAVARAIRSGRSSGVTVGELADRYEVHVRRKYARRASQVPHYRTALKKLRSHASDLAVEEFGPVALTTLRDAMTRERTEPGRSKYVRRTVNEAVARILRCFKWGVSVELVPESVYRALTTLEPIEEGEEPFLRESEEVSGIPVEDAWAVLPFLSRQLRAVVELQILTGARPSELLHLRPVDIDRSDQPWIMIPQSHKNAWRENGQSKKKKHKRDPVLCSDAQAILEPFLRDRLPTAPLFSPSEAEAERHSKRHAARRADPLEGNRPGYSKRVRNGEEPKKAPGATYTADSYRRALTRACDRAGVERFTPYQLRHTSITLAEGEAGELESSAHAGHKDPSVTKRYHEDRQRRKNAIKAQRAIATKLRELRGREPA